MSSWPRNASPGEQSAQNKAAGPVAGGQGLGGAPRARDRGRAAGRTGGRAVTRHCGGRPAPDRSATGPRTAASSRRAPGRSLP